MTTWITTDNQYEENWRRLLVYANIEITLDTIVKRHGNYTAKTKPNYIKQAKQVRVSLLQAKEYFDAARSSTLFTQPNHLYYGAVALSTACMLIRGDGSKSLDFLRNNNKNAHHGLNFTFSSTKNGAQKDIDLLKNSYVQILKNGHFSNWFDTLETNQPLYALIKSVSQQYNSTHTNLSYSGISKLPLFSTLIKQKTPLDILIKRLPDLFQDLLRFGVNVDAARGQQVIIDNLDTQEQQHEFVFHGASSSQALQQIIQQFNCSNGVCFSINVLNGATTGIVTTKKAHHLAFSYPDSRETLDHKSIYYKDSIDIPEVIDLYLISYALSMLSRYFPDIWVSFLESHCKGAKIVERIIHILMLKLPNLMLNQFTNEKFVISTHRPTWH